MKSGGREKERGAGGGEIERETENKGGWEVGRRENERESKRKNVSQTGKSRSMDGSSDRGGCGHRQAPGQRHMTL